MTTKSTENKTTDAEQLKDEDLDRVQGGWSWGETNSGTFAKQDRKGIIPETPIPAAKGLKMDDPKKDN